MDPFDLRLWPEFVQAGGNSNLPFIIDQVCIDSRRISSSHALFIALKGSEDGHQYVEHAIRAGAKAVIVSCNFDSSVPEERLLRVKSPLVALQTISSIYRLGQKAKVIAIGGTYGKTMLKDLLIKLLSDRFQVTASPESFNSQIGVPLSLLTIQNTHEIALIEAAISKPNEMDFLAEIIRPDAAIIAPIGKKHLATLQNIAIAADEILKLLKNISNGWSLIPNSLKEKEISCSKIYFWDEPSPHLPHAEPLTDHRYQIRFPCGYNWQGRIPCAFYYYLNLINMAIKTAWLLGISTKTIISKLLCYKPESMRTEIWRSPSGALFINDSYCHDPQSVSRALKYYEQTPGQRKIFVFNGMKGCKNPAEVAAQYRCVGHSIKQESLDLLLLVGQYPYDHLVEQLPDLSIVHCQDKEEGFLQLKKHLKPTDTVLFKGENRLALDELIERFNGSIHNNQCTINLDAVRHNISMMRSRLPANTRLMVIVKAFAYGTGDLHMAKFLKNCQIDILGVSQVEEGISLKKAGVVQKIFVIHAAHYEAAKVVEWEFEVSVSEKTMIQALQKEAAQRQKKIKVHLHIDSGMGRFGCRPEEALELAKLIVSSSSLHLEGIMTHFSSADDPQSDPFTHHQAGIFDSVIAELRSHQIEAPWIHASSSSAAIRFDFPHYNMVRIGLALYGIYASASMPKNLEFQLALSLTSRIVGINLCKKGESISYGRHYIVSKPEQRIAILPLGYFDGLHRNYSNTGYVIIRGKKAPRVGKICMDFMMVDISEIPDAAIGDPVLIFGKDEYGQYLAPEELAKTGDSITHELITCLGPRIPRLFVYEERE